MILRASRQALRLAIVVALAMTPMWFGVSPASAATWNPPPPDKQDACGTLWDRYTLAAQSGTVWRDLQGNSLETGVPLSTGGAATVKVVAKNYIDPDRIFTLTFGTEPNSSCVEAQDTISMVSSGMCYVDSRGQSRVPVTLGLTNTPDTSWQHDSVTVTLIRDGAEVEVLNFWDIADGETQSLMSVNDMETAESNQYFNDVRAGTYRFKLVVDGKPAVILPNPVVIAGCGGKNDGVGQGSDKPGSPTAQVTKVTCRVVGLNLLTRGVKSATAFKVVVKGKGKAKIKRTVAQNSKAKVKAKVRKPRVVKVTANGKVVIKQRLPRKC